MRHDTGLLEMEMCVLPTMWRDITSLKSKVKVCMRQLMLDKPYQSQHVDLGLDIIPLCSGLYHLFWPWCPSLSPVMPHGCSPEMPIWKFSLTKNNLQGLYHLIPLIHWSKSTMNHDPTEFIQGAARFCSRSSTNFGPKVASTSSRSSKSIVV